MRKKWMVWLVVVLLASSLLCACGASQNQNGEQTENTTEEGNAKAKKNKQKKKQKEEQEVQEHKATDYVQEFFSKQDSVRFDEYYTLEVDYHVPEITLDCEGAKVINQKIQEVCEDVMVESENPDDYSLWREVSYEAYLNQDVLSVVIEKISDMSDFREYYAYNLNVTTGQESTTEELAKVAGMEMKQLPRAIQKAAIYGHDQMTMESMQADYFGDEESELENKYSLYANFLMTRSETLSPQNITPDLPMYLGENGELQCIVPTYVMAGAGMYHHVVTVRKESAAEDIQLSFEGILVNYENGKMTIKIEENDWTQSVFQGYGSHFSFDKEYVVEGVYKDYIQGEMLAIINGEYIVPVFVADDHSLAYLDIYSGASADYFCLTEMVYTTEPVESINDSNAEQIAEILRHYILERPGSFERAAMGLYEDEGISIELAREDIDGRECTYNYYMGFDMEDPGRFLVQESIYDRGEFYGFDGKCTYLGMNDQGMIFTYDVLYTEPTDPEPCIGAFTVKRQGEWNETQEDWRTWMDYTWLSGYDFYDSQGEVLEFEVAVG